MELLLHQSCTPLVAWVVRIESFMHIFQIDIRKKKRKLRVYCLVDKKKNKFCFGKIPFVHVYVVVDLFTTLQTHTQKIRCLLLQRIAKFHQMLVQLYYPSEFIIFHTLHVTTALNVI